MAKRKQVELHRPIQPARPVVRNFSQNVRAQLPVEGSLFLRHGPLLQPAQVAHRLGGSRQPARTKIAERSVAAQPAPQKFSKTTRLLRWPAPKRAKIRWPLRWPTETNAKPGWLPRRSAPRFSKPRLAALPRPHPKVQTHPGRAARRFGANVPCTGDSVAGKEDGGLSTWSR